MQSEKIKISLLEVSKIKLGLDMISSKEMPIKLSWKISKILRVIDPICDSLNKESRKLIKKYGVEKEDKSGWIIPNNLIENYNQDKEELYSQTEDLEIPFLCEKDFDSLSDCDISISPEFFNLIDPISNLT